MCEKTDSYKIIEYLMNEGCTQYKKNNFLNATNNFKDVLIKSKQYLCYDFYDTALYNLMIIYEKIGDDYKNKKDKEMSNSYYITALDIATYIKNNTTDENKTNKVISSIKNKLNLF